MKRFTVATLFALALVCMVGEAWALNFVSYNASSNTNRYSAVGYSLANRTGTGSFGNHKAAALNGTFSFYTYDHFNSSTAGYTQNLIGRNASGAGTTHFVKYYTQTLWFGVYGGLSGVRPNATSEQVTPWGDITGFNVMRGQNVTGPGLTIGSAQNMTTNQTNLSQNLWFVGAPGSTVLFGAGNYTYNSSNIPNGGGSAHNFGNCSTFLTLIQDVPLTTKQATWNDSGKTWYFYNVMYNNTVAGVRVGKFSYSTSKASANSATSSKANATVSYYDSLAGTVTNVGMVMNMSEGSRFSLFNNTVNIFRNATLDNSTNVMAASWVNRDAAGPTMTGENATVVFSLALKDAATLTASDLQQGWKLVSGGALVNMTVTNTAAMYTNHTTPLVKGQQGEYYSTFANFRVASDNSAVGSWANVYTNVGQAYTLESKATTTTLATDSNFKSSGVSQSLVYLNNRTHTNTILVLGRYVSSLRLFAGVYLGNYTPANGFDHVGIFAMTGAQGSTGSVNAVAGFTTNSSTVSQVVKYNGTSKTQMGLIGDTTWPAIQTKYNIPTAYTMLVDDWVGFNATTATGYPATYVFSYSVTGVAVDKVSQVKLLKLNNSTVTSADGSLARNAMKEFSYSETGSASIQDGKWWFSETAAGSALALSAPLNQGTTYYINVCIKDNGGYDMNSLAYRIKDPSLPVLTPGTTAGSSSSSSSGCVFNPAAGFGLEWLLLLLAPAIGIIRSRFKK